jgi:hypothetical protein
MGSSNEKTLARPRLADVRRTGASQRKAKTEEIVNRRLLKAAAEMKARQRAGKSDEFLSQGEAARRLAGVVERGRNALKKTTPKR